MSEIVGWVLAVILAGLAWHNYRRWQFWADEWAKQYQRQRDAAFPAVFVGGDADGKRLTVSALTREVRFPTLSPSEVRRASEDESVAEMTVTYGLTSYRFDHAVFAPAPPGEGA